MAKAGTGFFLPLTSIERSSSRVTAADITMLSSEVQYCSSGAAVANSAVVCSAPYPAPYRQTDVAATPSPFSAGSVQHSAPMANSAAGCFSSAVQTPMTDSLPGILSNNSLACQPAIPAEAIIQAALSESSTCSIATSPQAPHDLASVVALPTDTVCPAPAIPQFHPAVQQVQVELMLLQQQQEEVDKAIAHLLLVRQQLSTATRTIYASQGAMTHSGRTTSQATWLQQGQPLTAPFTAVDFPVSSSTAVLQTTLC